MTKAKTYWLALMLELGLKRSQWQPFWSELEKLYREKHRAYHRLKHIGQFLDYLHRFCASKSGARPGLAQRIAVFYHDAIYDPTRKDNEYRSWLMAKAFIESVIADSVLRAQLLRDVEGFIMATASHVDKHAVSGVKQEELDLFLDCDLLILASSPRAYDVYCRQIRFEYSHFSDVDYRAGRKAFLSKFVEVPVLFRTAAVKAYADKRARDNMRRELKQLG